MGFSHIFCNLLYRIFNQRIHIGMMLTFGSTVCTLNFDVFVTVLVFYRAYSMTGFFRYIDVRVTNMLTTSIKIVSENNAFKSNS